MGGNTSNHDDKCQVAMAAHSYQDLAPDSKHGDQLDLPKHLRCQCSPYRTHKDKGLSSPTLQKLLRMGRVKVVKKQNVPVVEEDEQSEPSHMDIRKGQERELEENRPMLTQKQMKLVLQTWRILRENTDRVGTDMFIRLFETFPDIKGAFVPFRSMSAEDMRLSSELRQHGVRVMKTVSTLLDRHDDMDFIIDFLHKLGRKHVTYSAKAAYMDIVSQMFLFAIEPELNDHWNPEVEQAWADLFKLIVHVMREAMVL